VRKGFHSLAHEDKTSRHQITKGQSGDRAILNKDTAERGKVRKGKPGFTYDDQGRLEEDWDGETVLKLLNERSNLDNEQSG